MGGRGLSRAVAKPLTGRSLAIMLLRLAAVWAVLGFVVWPTVQRAYSAAVTHAASTVLAVAEWGQGVTHLRAEGSFIHVFTDLSEEAEPGTSLDANVLHFYLVLLVSIILAFPALELRRRISILTFTIVGIFLFHVSVVLLNVEYMYAVILAKVSERNYSDFERIFWKWMHDTADYYAMDVLPASALVALVVWHRLRSLAQTDRVATGRKVRAASERRRPVRCSRWVTRAAICFAVLVIFSVAGLAGWHQMHHIRARQAEKETHLGYQALKTGGLTQAVIFFTAASNRSPGFAQARLGLGQALMRQGKLRQATDEFRAAAKMAPGDAAVHMHLGSALFAAGDLESAAAEFEESIRIEPRNKEALFNLGMTFKRLGRMDDAEANLRRALAISPDYAEALFELSASMIATGRACGTVEYLERLARQEPTTQRGRLARQTLEDLQGRCPRG